MDEFLSLVDWFAREGERRVAVAGQWREKKMAGLAGVSTVRIMRSGSDV